MLLSEALWTIVVENPTTGLPEWTGTGFSVDGYGLVSNLHVVDLSKAPKGSVLKGRAGAQGSWQALVVSRSSGHHDLAVLETQIPSLACLVPSDQGPAVGKKIVLAGFPNWHIGDAPRFEGGEITRMKTVSLVEWCQLNATVEQGNSGGPVLDAQGSVVAIAAKGDGGLPFPNAAISAKHLNDI